MCGEDPRGPHRRRFRLSRPSHPPSAETQHEQARRLHPASKKAVKARVSERTYRHTQNQSLATLLEGLNRTLSGWATYFRHHAAKRTSTRSTTTRGTVSRSGSAANTASPVAS
ncbi:hypothetical protein I3F55_09670 [Streptomyces sp. MUM 16J]|nr:hypothetical protein [Streptomyces sp. MUM 16J]